MISAIELRHWMHQNPELSHQEFETTRILEKSIRSISTDLKIMKPLPTGLLVVYQGKTKDFLLIRADIDALPFQENQNMHACGHDVHTAILYRLIQKVVKTKSNQSCIFLFQPGEEMGGGAKLILDSGVLKAYPVSSAMCLHVSDEYPFGSVATKQGTFFSASCEIDINWQGKESHITQPEQGMNALTSLNHFLNWTQVHQSNNVFFGIGRIKAGTIRNITPASASLQGTIRGTTKEDIDNYLREIDIFLETKQSNGEASFQIILGTRYP